MVCKDCKIGGELNEQGVSLREAGNAAKAAAAFDAADRAHGLCAGCDCQHMTGVILHWPHVHVEGRPE